MDFATLKALKPGEFDDAAEGYRTTSHMAGHAKDELDQRITVRLNQAVKGEAADAALKQLRKLSQNFHYAQVECGLLHSALRALASELRSAKKKLNAAIADAHDEKFTVGPDGSVSYPAAGKDHGSAPGGTVTGASGGSAARNANQVFTNQSGQHPPATPPATPSTGVDANGCHHTTTPVNPHAAAAQAIADRIAKAVREATEADDKWAPQIRKLKADDDLTVSSADWADAQKDTRGTAKDAQHYFDQHVTHPPKHGSPRDNAEWWKHLSKEDRDAYISLHPDSVGAMDGIPSDVRDEANRAVLSEKQGEYQQRLAHYPPEPLKWTTDPQGRRVPTREWQKWNAGKLRLQHGLKGMNGIQQRFDRTGEDGLPEAYLLGFDPESKTDGKVILANGNPDTADHTGIYVPGTKTKFANAGDPDAEFHRSEQLWKQSHALSPHQKVSTITWFDYNAPDDVTTESTKPGYAQDGAPALQRYLEGNRAAHEYATGHPGHTTLVGHSYGSTLIGETAKYAQQHGTQLPADDVVVAGSPGMQVGHAKDLGIGAHHVWAMEGQGDDDIVTEGGRSAGLGQHDRIPTDRDFGGHVLASDAKNHGAYWDSGSTSLHNQAAVVTGHNHQVKMQDWGVHHRDPSDLGH